MAYNLFGRPPSTLDAVLMRDKAIKKSAKSPILSSDRVSKAAARARAREVCGRGQGLHRQEADYRCPPELDTTAAAESHIPPVSPLPDTLQDFPFVFRQARREGSLFRLVPDDLAIFDHRHSFVAGVLGMSGSAILIRHALHERQGSFPYI